MFLASQAFPMSQRVSRTSRWQEEEDSISDDPYTSEELVIIASKFVRKYIDRVLQTNLPDRGTGADHGHDGAVLDRCGFDIVLQVVYASFSDLTMAFPEEHCSSSKSSIFVSEETPSREVTLLAPETQESDVASTPKKADPWHRTFVPETMAMFSPAIDEEMASQDSSPSLLASSKRIQSNASKRELPRKAPTPKKPAQRQVEADKKMASPRKLAKSSRVTVTNSFGIQVDRASLSQIQRQERLKQSTINRFVGNGRPAARDRDEDQVRKAIELSKQTAREEELKREQAAPAPPERQPLESLDENKAAGFKYVGSPVRSKAARRQLVGHDCHECRKFYESGDYTEEQIARLLKCSKHRSRFAPPPDSPRGPWELDIVEDPVTSKTQPSSPLRTRKRRREMRAAKQAAAAQNKHVQKDMPPKSPRSDEDFFDE